VKLPRGVGTSTPKEVAEAVLRGIERDRPEIDVAPLAMRGGVKAATLAPLTSARIQRLLGSEELADRMRAGQRDKR
jgi:hypothetical protein